MGVTLSLNASLDACIAWTAAGVHASICRGHTPHPHPLHSPSHNHSTVCRPGSAQAVNGGPPEGVLPASASRQASSSSGDSLPQRWEGRRGKRKIWEKNPLTLLHVRFSFERTHLRRMHAAVQVRAHQPPYRGDCRAAGGW